MNPEEANKIKCDRCGVTAGLYRHSVGWRCPGCIWSERENLITWTKRLLATIDYNKTYGHDGRTVEVNRKGVIALSDVVKEVTS